MTHELDASAILAHLNELGYCFITTSQLKEFIKDLKKLIKYEERHLKEIQKEYIFEKSNKLYLTPTLSSKAKSLKEKEQNREKISNTRVEIPSKIKKNYIQPSNLVKSAPLINVQVNETSTKCTRHDCGHQILPDQCQESLGKNISNKSSKNTIKKTSRPHSTSSIPSKRRNTDPVELYHRYKKEWDKQKIPGENSHLELRWAIRQRMI